MGFATSREQQRSKAQLGLGPNPEEQPPAVQPGAGSPCPSAQHEANVGDSSLLVPLSQKCRAGLSCVQVSAPEAEPAKSSGRDLSGGEQKHPLLPLCPTAGRI